MDKNRSILKPTLQITFFSIIGIIISFVSQLVIAYYFGTAFERDSYFVAAIIPTYISSVFIGSFGIIFLPKVVDILNRGDRQLLSIFISTTISILLALLLGITFACVFFPSKITQFIAPGYTIEQINITSKLLTVIGPTIIFTILSNLLGSLYQIQHRFIRPALAPILASIVSLIFVVFLSDKIGIFALAFGFLSGSFISFITLLPILKKYNISFHVSFKNIDVKSFAKTLTPLLLSGVLFRSTGVVERMIASTLPQGSISYLGYSSQLLSVLGTLTANGIAVSTFPLLSRLWSEKKKIEFITIFTKTTRIILIFAIPISISIVFFGDQYIKLIFERGAFTAKDTIAVNNALVWAMGAFVFQSLGSIVAKILYISGLTIISSIIATIELIIYFLLSYLLSKYYSYIGLSISLSISSMINIFLSAYFINKKVSKLNYFSISKDILKIFLASFLSVWVLYFLFLHVHFITYPNIKLVFFMIIELIIYYLLCRILRIEEILQIQSLIKNKLPK